MNICKKSPRYAAAVAVCLSGAQALAAPGVPDSDPLIVKGFAKPNILLLIDTSGSMNNIVPDTPYDATVTYVTCNSGNEITPDATKTVELIVRTSGNVGYTFMRYNGNYYDWGNAGSTALNNLTKRCFRNDATYPAKLNADATCTISNSNNYYCPDGGWLDADYTGNYLNWYFSSNNAAKAAASPGGGVFKDGNNAARTKPVTGGATGFAQSRMTITKTAAKTLVDGITDVRMGLSTYDASGNGNGGQIKKGLADLDTTAATAIKTSIDGLVATGATPLGESFADLGRYFIQGNETVNLDLHPDGKPIAKDAVRGSDIFNHEPGYDNSATDKPTAATSTIQYSCQKSFIVAMTDGRPQSDQAISNYLKDYDGDCTTNAGKGLNLDRKTDGTEKTTAYRGANKCEADFTWASSTKYPTSSSFYDMKKASEGYSYEGAGSGFSSDVTAALYDMDLRPDETTMPGKQNVSSYMIGFADLQAQNDPLLKDAAKLGGGKFYTANNAAQVLASFQAAAQEIKDSGGTAASVAFNSSTLSSDSAIYLVQFNSAKWSGQVLAYRLDGTTGALAASPAWDAAQKLNAQTPTNRVIVTHDGYHGVPLRWAADGINQSWWTVPLSTDLNNNDTANNTSDSLASSRVSYLRGDRSQEQTTSGGTFRARAGALGDIVNSTPIFVGKSQSRWPDLNPFGTASERFSGFAASSSSRTPVLYVGANDGLLHGFDATIGTADSGKEVLGYMPAAPVSTLSNQGLHFLTSPKYTHRFYVDLTPSVADVYINADRTKTDVDANRDWHTVLVGGLGRGGMGYFALDVNDPSKFLESNAEKLVLWEFTSANDSDMGYSYSEPTIAMMNNNKWAVIFGNGYESANGNATLFILFLEAGKSGWTGNYVKIDTGIGSLANKNGLSSPQAADLDGDGKVDRIYAGDVQGNVWAFNVTGSDTTKWGVAHKNTSGQKKPLFTAKDANGTAQPITARPLLARNIDNTTTDLPNIVVMIGTGQYLTATDITNTQAQSFYVIGDRGTGELARANLLARTFTASNGMRSVASTQVASAMSWTTYSGWYIDLNAGSNSLGGERVVSQGLLRRRVLLFNTMIPDKTPCKSGGTGWLMSFDFLTGVGLPAGIFDGNKDNQITAADASYIGQFVSLGLPTRSGILGSRQYTPTSKGEGKGSLVDREINTGASDKEGRLGWEEIVPR